MLIKLLAFLKKDFLTESSYKLSFLFNVFGVFVSVAIYYFIDKLFGNSAAAQLKEFGVGYFAYVLLGMAFFSYIGVGLGSFSERIRTEQLQGTLEPILMTPTGISIILFSLAIWNLLVATFDMLTFILLGIFLFKINFYNINMFSTLVVLILTIAAFSSLGIISASFIMVFKRGNPVGWIISSLEGLIGGVYFPITVLPEWAQLLAKLLPITYSIRAIELAVYRGYSLWQIKTEVGFLLLFSLVLLPLSFYSFKFAVKKARKSGSLAQY